MDAQLVELEGEERNDGGQARPETDIAVKSPNPESGTWKDARSSEEPLSPVGFRLDRLTQFLAGSLSRRRLTDFAAALLLGLGLQADVDAKKRKKKKKKKRGNGNTGETCTPACEDGFTCRSGSCTCASNVLCDEQCCAADETCLEAGCCTEARACDGDCCPQSNTCIRNECCFDTRVCDGDCCEANEFCANIVPGGIKGCCEHPLSIRGESCCPTGSLATVLNCGSFQCKAGLSGTGPGGCDMWCEIGVEGSACGPGIEGFPVPGDPGRGCCCADLGSHICVYPIPGG